MTPEQAHRLIVANVPFGVGSFYGALDGLALGAGLLFSPIRFPTFIRERMLFGTSEGLVLVISHECDVEQENHRPYNQDVLVCPVFPAETIIEELCANWSERVHSFLVDVAQRRVPRMRFIPSNLPALPFGGFILCNRLATTHIDAFIGKAPVAALSVFGLREVDAFLADAFFRPKSDALSFSARA